MGGNAISETTEGSELIQRAIASGLRGRGGGWFPVGRKWHAVAIEGGEPLVVANGAEGEPGSIKDRFVLETRAREVVEGIVLAARAVGAREAVVYLKGSFEASARALEGVLAQGVPAGLNLRVHRGEEGYIVGEETALLESLEWKRAWPRPKPPLPAAVGFQGRPTLVQNVETLARVPEAIREAEGFGARERTFVSLWGSVRRPGVYEVPLGTPLRRILEENGQGTPNGVSMVFPAGPSAAPLGPAQLETALHPDALRAAGSGLGTGSILVVRSGVCPLLVGASLAGFFERESCGQCPPCSVGSQSLARVLRAIEAGSARAADLQSLAEVAGFMSDHGYCAHSRTAAAAVSGLLARFRDDVAAHLAAGRCPRPGPPADPFAPGSPERAAIEAALDHCVRAAS